MLLKRFRPFDHPLSDEFQSSPLIAGEQYITLRVAARDLHFTLADTLARWVHYAHRAVPGSAAAASLQEVGAGA